MRSLSCEQDPRFQAVMTGAPVVQLLACVVCGVLLWDIDAHYAHAHSQAESEEREAESYTIRVPKSAATGKFTSIPRPEGRIVVAESEDHAVTGETKPSNDRVPLYNSDGTPRSNDEIREHASRINADRAREKLIAEADGWVNADLVHRHAMSALDTIRRLRAALAAPVEVDAEALREARAETWDEAIAAVHAWWSMPPEKRPAVIVNPYGVGLRSEGR